MEFDSQLFCCRSLPFSEENSESFDLVLCVRILFVFEENTWCVLGVQSCRLAWGVLCSVVRAAPFECAQFAFMAL